MILLKWIITIVNKFGINFGMLELNWSDLFCFLNQLTGKSNRTLFPLTNRTLEKLNLIL